MIKAREIVLSEDEYLELLTDARAYDEIVGRYEGGNVRDASGSTVAEC